MAPYRDSLAAVRERVRVLEGDTRRKSRRVSAVALAIVPETLARRVDELRPRIDEKPGRTLAAWLEREAALAELAAALDEVEARVPTLVAAASPPPPPAPQGRLSYLGDASRRTQLRHEVESELARYARGLERSRWGEHGWLWELRLRGIGLKLTGRAWRDVIELRHVELAVFVAMPPAVGPLRVTTASWWYGDTAKRILGEPDLGDNEFTDHFRVEGPERLGRVLLTAEVQQWLLSLRPHDPCLQLGGGVASLQWKVEVVAHETPKLGVLEGARALAGLRAALR